MPQHCHKVEREKIVREIMKHHNDTSSLEVQKVAILAPGHDVLFYRGNERRTRYKMVRVRGHEVNVVLTRRKISTFGANRVRPYY